MSPLCRWRRERARWTCQGASASAPVYGLPMSSAAAPPPITGTPIDPPPVKVPTYAEKLDQTDVGGIAYRAMRRYSYANVGLLANGTAYYLILSVFSVLAFAYGVTAIVGADHLAQVLTDALSEALPGLV